jgi:hypothetical protein
MPPEHPGAAAPASRALLMAWLAAADEPGREAVLAHFAGPGADKDAVGELAYEYLAVALAGPSYAGDRGAEAVVQADLLALAAALGRRAGAWAVAAEAELARATDPTLPAGARLARLRDAVALARRGEAWRPLGRAAIALVPLLVADDRPEEAEAALREAWEAGAHHPDVAAEADAAVARLADDPGRHPRRAVVGLLAAWRGRAKATGDRRAAAEAALRLGEAALIHGDLPRAIPMLAEAEALFGEVDDEPRRARALVRRMAAAIAAEDMTEAARLAELAGALRMRTEDPDVRAVLDDPGF